MHLPEESLRPLQQIGWNPAAGRMLAEHPGGEAGLRLARLVERQRGVLHLHSGLEVLEAVPTPAFEQDLAARGEEPAVGDWLLFRQRPGETPGVVDRLAPRTVLRRVTSNGTRQTLAANVDTAFVVCGLDGDFNPRRIERYLALIRGGGVFPVIVLTKLDVHPEGQDRLTDLGRRLPPGIPMVALDAREPGACGDLLPFLGAGETVVLLGSSGAGKSTLMNTLAGEGWQRTSAVREGDDRGRHTTTTRILRRLPQGACLIDTPGLRGLRLDGDDETLDAGFSDIAALAERCRFRDCRHEDEPGCAVVGAVDPDRLANYRKLLAEQRRRVSPIAARQAEKAWGKMIHRFLKSFYRTRERR